MILEYFNVCEEPFLYREKNFAWLHKAVMKPRILICQFYKNKMTPTESSEL